jgi:hypothetical protein
MAMTISGSTGVTYPDGSSQSSGQQACKAWVNFNGTGTVAIRGSYNVTSITDGGTGVYTVNFTTAMSNVNYSVVCSGHSSGFGRQSNAFAAWDGYSTASVVIWTGNTINAAAEDLNTVNIAVFR